MDTTIALLGVVIAIVGWPVSYFLTRSREVRLEHDKAKLDLLRRRLDEFYSPIYGLLLENDRIRQLISDEFGRGVIFVGNKPLTDEEKKIWVHYLENYVIPNNREILDILQTKIHLFVGETYPESFRHWIDHALGYELFHKQYKDIGREYGFHSCMNFPSRFQTDIVNAISQLTKLQDRIAGVELPSPFIEKPPNHGIHSITGSAGSE
jgi:hypothetical protein